MIGFTIPRNGSGDNNVLDEFLYYVAKALSPSLDINYLFRDVLSTPNCPDILRTVNERPVPEP